MILDKMRLDGKVALVTGGSSGIGEGMAIGLAQAGASVCCVYRTHYPTALEDAMKDLGGDFFGIKEDLAGPGAVSRVMAALLERFGRLDILVNCAGICPREPFLDYQMDTWNQIIQLNQTVVFEFSQAASRQFIKQATPGKIINLASMMSYLGGFNTTAYTASKHAVVGLTRVMANELAVHHINVNAVAPGWIRTNLSKPLYTDPDRYASVCARIPSGDWGYPEDFMGVTVFLASEASDYITGVTIPVDGGYLTK